jgi:hypothetical protein
MHLFSMRTGVLANDRKGVLLASDDGLAAEDVAHTFVFRWLRDGEWGGQRWSWTAISVCYSRLPTEQFVAIGETGQFVAWAGETVMEGRILDSTDRRGPFRSVAEVDGYAYAAGMGGIVYRRDDSHVWTRIDSAVPIDINFEAVGGFSSRELYAVGWRGELWLFDGSSWSRLDSQTNTILTRVCCAQDGNVYCCGQRGVLLRGRENRWDVIDSVGVSADLWDVKWFGGQVYVSTISSLYNLVDNELVQVRFGEDLPLSFYHLSVADRALWSIGCKDVMHFDGDSWERVLPVR